MILRTAGLMITLAGPALALSTRAETPEFVPVTYRCEGGVTVPVVFINPPGADRGYASTVIDGRLLVLGQAISGSGARYRTDQPAPGYQIWIKGDAAMITRGPEDGDEPIATGCRSAP